MKVNNTSERGEETDKRIKRRTFISFSVFTLAGTAGYGLWHWFRSLSRNDNRLSWLSRKVLRFNERVNSKFYSNGHLAPEYPKSMAVAKPRLNGYAGMSKGFDPASWILQVQSDKTAITVTLEELKSLPKTEIVFDFKCIEGWNEIVHYGGVRFSDFLRHYDAGTMSGQPVSETTSNDLYRYVGLETPDKKYFVGMDMKSMLHPQTILCYELNEKALPYNHGAPLRLITPVKYGVKNIKRIGRIFFSNDPPPDYWFQRGYDYDLGL